MKGYNNAGQSYTTTITLDMYDGRELDFPVEFFINEGYSDTYWEPGEPAHIEDFDFEDKDIRSSGYTEAQITQAVENYIEEYEDIIMDDAWKIFEDYYGDMDDWSPEC